MTKTLATVFGIAYVLMGIAGTFGTSLVGENGFFVADFAYSLAFMAVGAVLLFGVLFREGTARGITLSVGTLLAIVAISGFLIVPERGELFGMLVNSMDHVVNLVVGLILAGVALLERGRREFKSLREQRYLRPMRHAMQ